MLICVFVVDAVVVWRCGTVIRKNAASRQSSGRKTNVRLLSCGNNSRKSNQSFRAHESSAKTRPAASSQVTTTRTSSFGLLMVNVSFATRATRLISDLPSKKYWGVQSFLCRSIVPETSSSESMFLVRVWARVFSLFAALALFSRHLALSVPRSHLALEPPSRVALIHSLTTLMKHSYLPLSFLVDVAFLQELNDRIMRNEFLKEFNATLRRLTDDKYIKAEIDLTDYANRFERSLQSLENLTSHQEDQLRKCFRVCTSLLPRAVDPALSLI